jgi:hypothetical protein
MQGAVFALALTEGADLAAPMMSAGARPPSPQRTWANWRRTVAPSIAAASAKKDCAVLLGRMNLEYVFGQVHPDNANLFHGRLPL